jgi:GMP synthase-like glutamine amidotransferase
VAAIMRVHVLQHVPFEGPGSILAWLQSRSARLTTTRYFESASLPGQSDFDVLVVLGGSMSVNDETRFPWLMDEKRFVRESIQSGKSVLGICLGAQLIAAALGACVYPGVHKEIGWFPVHAENHGTSAFRFPETMEVFHWHGETFDLPAGAVHLARSAACPHQAFQVGARAIGLQFHLETTPESAEAIIKNCRHELVAAPYVQTEEQLRAAPASRYAGINRLMEDVLDYITRDRDRDPAARAVTDRPHNPTDH